MPIDFIVRGEGEITLRELTRALEGKGDMHFISGLSHRHEGKWIHNQLRAPTAWTAKRFVCPREARGCLKGTPCWGGRWM